MGVRHELERSTVGGRGILVALEPPEQVRPSRVEQVVAVQLAFERDEEREPAFGTVGHRDRDRAVELDDG